MDEVIEVYFKNENDAESAQAQLRTLKVRNLHVEEMPEDTDRKLFVPFFSTNTESTTVGSTGIGPVGPIIPETREGSQEPDYPSYLLHVEVETEDYDHVLAVLEGHECFMRE